MTNVEYKISLYPSKFLAYQSKARDNGIITLFISNIIEKAGWEFNKFVVWIDFLTLLERVCLERGFQKIKLKNRCKSYKNFPCKMGWVGYNLYF